MSSWTRPFRPFFLLAALLPLACGAQPMAFQEGKQYAQVKQSVPPADAKRVTVEEFFWYGCPHCFAADPSVDAWKAKKPDYVDFQRIPNTLGRADGEIHARAFYIAEALGVLDKTHGPLFSAIHVRKQPMNSVDSIRKLYGEVAGVKPEDFDKATSSFMVDSRLRRAEQLARTYQLTSVPTIVVGGKYVTNATMSGGMDKLMAVVSFLTEKVRLERK
ncbi:MAG: thiol:disulfide interchange protein DsbA/DsbL [Stagnimonas sp.]|nr:thiol:disulfide interchange protein DsbA/DsbL [Stagnimonas sp.]